MWEFRWEVGSESISVDGKPILTAVGIRCTATGSIVIVILILVAWPTRCAIGGIIRLVVVIIGLVIGIGRVRIIVSPWTKRRIADNWRVVVVVESSWVWIHNWNYLNLYYINFISFIPTNYIYSILSILFIQSSWLIFDPATLSSIHRHVYKCNK